jgi:hypothetical protein
MGMSPAKIDSILRALKNFGPYGVFLAFGFLGLSIFYIGGLATAVSGKLAPEGRVMRWIGVGFCFVSLVFLTLWHLFSWPASMLASMAPAGEVGSRAPRRR